MIYDVVEEGLGHSLIIFVAQYVCFDGFAGTFMLAV
jgi:hypothetical protein